MVDKLYDEADELGIDREEAEKVAEEIRDWASKFSLEDYTISCWVIAHRLEEKGFKENAARFRNLMWQSADRWCIWVEKNLGIKIWWNEKLGRFQEVATGRIFKSPTKSR